MAVLLAVLAAGDVNPVVEAVAGLEDELVEVGVLLEEGEPTVGHVHVSVRLPVLPGGVWSLGQTDVGGFTQGVLTGIDASYPDVQGRAAIAGADDDGLAGKRTEGFEDDTAELLQGGDVLHGDGVVDAVLLGYG